MQGQQEGSCSTSSAHGKTRPQRITTNRRLVGLFLLLVSLESTASFLIPTATTTVTTTTTNTCTPKTPTHHHQFATCCVSYTSTTRLQQVSTTTTSTTATELEEKTVSELWEILQHEQYGENTPMERGLKSRLKRKQDLIAFIEEKRQPMAAIVEKNEEAPAGISIDPTLKSTMMTQENPEEEDGMQEEEESVVVAARSPSSVFGDDIAALLPSELEKKMIQREVVSFLPIQSLSFDRIFNGEDVVVQAPTGSGKTLAFLLPIVAKIWNRPSLRRGRSAQPASPLVIVIAPSRELARQIGRECSKYSRYACATVFGGVPIERHTALLRQTKPQIVISTPGRLRELVREGHMDYQSLSTVVLDEADTLLDKADSPDVRAILEDLETAVGEREKDDAEGDAEYQLVLVSATMNENVIGFARELEMPPSSLIRVQNQEPNTSSTSTVSSVPMTTTASTVPKSTAVQHWHTSCKSLVRPTVTLDLLSMLNPQLTIVFVSTKAEVESVAAMLSNKFTGSVRSLHGDMAQSARSRTMALIRETADRGDDERQVLVATDVASRGIDLQVDLVIQFGIPRLAGKDGTFSTELYTHRTGRTGRVRAAATGDRSNNHSNNAILLYDPAAGEGKLVPLLTDEVQYELGIKIQPRQLPSTSQLSAAGFERTKELLSLGDLAVTSSTEKEKQEDLVAFFRTKLESEQGLGIDTPKEELLEYLSRAMVQLSHLDPTISPFRQHASLLSGSSSDRTLRLVRRSNTTPLTPPDVTKICKELGSGKLGRVHICQDGSAVFDLSQKRAERLLNAMRENQPEEEDGDDWKLELPMVLPEVVMHR